MILGLSFIIYHLSFSHAVAQQMTDGDTHSPYILAVDEYVPAPGQFVNDIPLYEPGDNAQTMAAKCTEAIANNNGSLISLGGWGGYVTFHFDHSIANISGQRDFFIKGNAMQSMAFRTVPGGSSEPGIVMVSKDVNHNLLPDDPWYEISGSADADSVGLVDYGYSVTYQRNPMQAIPWTDNRGGSGVIPRMNQFNHLQEYYPEWLDDNLTFTGTRLPRNAYRYTMEVQGEEYGEWVLMFLAYGYADNQPNIKKDACSIDISWAIDENRQPVNLDFIDFVRVYTGVNQVIAELGETSTEIAGAEDLHLEASIAAIQAATGITELDNWTISPFDNSSDNGQIVNGQIVQYYTLDGRLVQSSKLKAQSLKGVYILRKSDGTAKKVIIK